MNLSRNKSGQICWEICASCVLGCKVRRNHSVMVSRIQQLRHWLLWSFYQKEFLLLLGCNNCSTDINVIRQCAVLQSSYINMKAQNFWTDYELMLGAHPLLSFNTPTELSSTCAVDWYSLLYSVAHVANFSKLFVSSSQSRKHQHLTGNQKQQKNENPAHLELSHVSHSIPGSPFIALIPQILLLLFSNTTIQVQIHSLTISSILSVQ